MQDWISITPACSIQCVWLRHFHQHSQLQVVHQACQGGCFSSTHNRNAPLNDTFNCFDIFSTADSIHQHHLWHTLMPDIHVRLRGQACNQGMFRQRMNMLLILPPSRKLCCFKKAAAGLNQDSMQQAQDSKCKRSCFPELLIVSKHTVADLFRQSGETQELGMEIHTYQQSHNNIDIELIPSHCSSHCWHNFSTAVLPQACDCLLPAA